MRAMRRSPFAALPILSCAGLLAQAPPPRVENIQDNSFLVEEAYNQETGVVQHISTFTRFQSTGDWAYTFTQEWPVYGLEHQLSFTVPLLGLEDGAKARKLGDVALNYRYQLAGDGDAAFACSPRFSVVLPTGDADVGYGSGDVGYQLGIPLSVALDPRLALHVNLGATWTPSAKSADGDRAGTFAPSVGGSLVWLATPTLNFMVESLYTRGESVVGRGQTAKDESFYVSPSFRAAINFESGLQIVPGIAFPIGVGPSAGDRAIFLYLSFEHPFKKLKGTS